MAINNPKSISHGSVVKFHGNVVSKAPAVAPVSSVFKNVPDEVQWTVVKQATITQNIGNSFAVDFSSSDEIKFTNGVSIHKNSDLWKTCTLVSGSGS